MIGTPPSDWVVRFAPLAKQGGRALDLAAGKGRHARHLRDAGFRVTAIDRDVSALSALEDIETVEADLEVQGGWRPQPGGYALIVVTNYLFRPLLPDLADALAAGGVLIYETFMQGNEALGRPRNPDFLLAPNELFEVYAPHLGILAFEQGRVERPAPAVIQRICAVSGAPRDFTL